MTETAETTTTAIASGAAQALRIAEKVAQVFAEAQASTKAAHRQLHSALRRLHHLSAQAGREKDFNRAFIDCLNLVLAARGGDLRAVDRLLDFVPAYVLFSKTKDAADRKALRQGSGCSNAAASATSSTSVRRKAKAAPNRETDATDDGDLAEAKAKAKTNANVDSEEENDDEDSSSYFSLQFAVWLLRYLLNGVSAKDKNVRYRCVRLIYGVSTHLTSIEYVLVPQLSI